MRLARKSSSHPATFRRTRIESLFDGLGITYSAKVSGITMTNCTVAVEAGGNAVLVEFPYGADFQLTDEPRPFFEVQPE